MGLFDFLRNKRRISIEQINDFYRYSEVSGFIGGSRKAGTGTMRFNSDFGIDSTHENGATVYQSIEFFCKEWAGYVYIENSQVMYRYTENKKSRWFTDCAVTTNENEINLITKGFFDWYNELNLPKAIDEMQKHRKAGSSVSETKETIINAFGDNAAIRVMSDKTIHLVFDFFPPRKGKLTKEQADSFEKMLADEIEKKVIRDDRELFIIYDDTQETIDHVIRFLQRFQ